MYHNSYILTRGVTCDICNTKLVRGDIATSYAGNDAHPACALRDVTESLENMRTHSHSLQLTKQAALESLYIEQVDPYLTDDGLTLLHRLLENFDHIFHERGWDAQHQAIEQLPPDEKYVYGIRFIPTNMTRFRNKFPDSDLL